MVNHHGRFVWYELVTTDVAAAAAFYAKVMGWGTRDASAPGLAYTLFSAGKSWTSGVTGLRDDAPRTSWIGYVWVDDVDATAGLIKRLGGSLQVPPTDVPNVSRFSVVSDPQMATLALVRWLNSDLLQLPAADSPGRVGWHELLAADSDKAIAFYGEVFGWKKASAEVGPLGTYHLFTAGGQTIGGICTKPPVLPLPFWLYYFNVGHIDLAAERVKAGGGQVIEGPVEGAGGNWVARCTDPQGGVFALEGKRGNSPIGYFVPAGLARDRGRPA